MLTMILINGLIFGGIYAILAVGFSLIFGVAKILNMAHTAFYMVGAYFIFIVTNTFGLSNILASVIGSILVGLIGVVCYIFLFDRVKQHETALMIVSVALGMLAQEIFLLLYSGHYRRVQPFVQGYFEIAGNRVSYQNVFTIVVCVITIAAIWFLLSKTKLGNAIRAVAQDREIANVMGIDVRRICMISMGLSAFLAGIAGAVVSPIYMVHPLMWLHPLVIVLAAVVLGGIGSIKGSIIAAFILGFSEAIIVFVVPQGSFLRGAVSLVIMVIMLLFRPEGMYGTVFEEERL